MSVLTKKKHDIMIWKSEKLPIILKCACLISVPVAVYHECITCALWTTSFKRWFFTPLCHHSSKNVLYLYSIKVLYLPTPISRCRKRKAGTECNNNRPFSMWWNLTYATIMLMVTLSACDDYPEQNTSIADDENGNHNRHGHVQV